MIYIRESKGNRHYCVECGRKRFEAVMEKIKGALAVSQFAMQRWKCRTCIPGHLYKRPYY